MQNHQSPHFKPNTPPFLVYPPFHSNFPIPKLCQISEGPFPFNIGGVFTLCLQLVVSHIKFFLVNRIKIELNFSGIVVPTSN